MLLCYKHLTFGSFTNVHVLKVVFLKMYILDGPEVQFKTKVDVFISMHAKEDLRVWKVSARSV